MRTYIGERRANFTARVYVQELNTNGTIDRRELGYRRGAGSHSPTGLEWGYGGSGPAELARALVVDATGQVDPPIAVYQAVKWALVASLPKAGWTLTRDQILAAIAASETSQT